MNNDGVRVFLREGAYTAAQIEALNQRLKEVMHMIGMHASVRDANDAGKRYRMAFKGMRNMEHEKIRRTKEHVDGMMREREMEEIRRLEQSVKERKKLLRERERRRK